MKKQFLIFQIITVIILATFVWIKLSQKKETSPKIPMQKIVHQNLPTQKKPQLRILALGDSLTAGYNISKQSAYPYLLEKTLNEKFPQYKTTVINAGISGSTTSSGAKRLTKHLNPKPPDVVLIALGANDGLRGIAISTIRKNLQSMIDLAQQNNMQVVLAGMKLPMNYGLKYRQSFENTFKDLSEENQITYIPFFLKEVAGQAEFNLPDRIHPNEKGHQIITQNLFSYLKKFYK